MVAIDLPDASLCGKISPNASFVDRYDGKKALLRVRCYESIAFNIGDSALRERLPQAGSFPHAIPEHDSRENCLKTVAFYRASPYWRGGGYGWQPFAHAPDFTAALVAIGYTDDGVIGTAVPTDEEYWQFLMHLRQRDTPEQERAAFVRRVLALPPEPRR